MIDNRYATMPTGYSAALTAGGITIHVADVGLLNYGVPDARNGQRLAHSLLPHHVIRLAGTRLAERNYADAGDDDFKDS